MAALLLWVPFGPAACPLHLLVSPWGPRQLLTHPQGRTQAIFRNPRNCAKLSRDMEFVILEFSLKNKWSLLSEVLLLFFQDS